MTTRPSNDAIAQAFWEAHQAEIEDGYPNNDFGNVIGRAREIDANSCATPDNPEVSGLANSEWVMVPKEPTEAMVDAGCAEHECEQGDSWYSNQQLSDSDTVAIYKAMIAAAPTPPKAERYVQWTPAGGVRVDIDAYLKSDAGRAALRRFADTAQPAPTPESIRDAERYQWLRANCVREWVSVMPDKAQAPTLDIGFTAPGHDLDAAIDAAIREQATDYLRDGLDLAFAAEWKAQGRAEQQSGEKDTEQQRAPSKSQAKRIAAQKGESDAK